LLQKKFSLDNGKGLTTLKGVHTPNANVAGRSVVARDELHEREAGWASLFCFDNSSPGKSCFIVD